MRLSMISSRANESQPNAILVGAIISRRNLGHFFLAFRSKKTYADDHGYEETSKKIVYQT
jgi:hypothetical protein